MKLFVDPALRNVEGAHITMEYKIQDRKVFKSLVQGVASATRETVENSTSDSGYPLDDSRISLRDHLKQRRGSLCQHLWVLSKTNESSNQSTRGKLAVIASTHIVETPASIADDSVNATCGD